MFAGKLQKGEPIVTPEGKEVFSEQVMSPSIPGPVCPAPLPLSPLYDPSSSRVLAVDSPPKI